MKKKLKIATILIIFISFGWFAYTNLYPAQNLRRYSVYYAHNMERKEGTHPEMAMAIENIGVIYKPNKKNIRYRDDGSYAIYNNSTDRKQAIISYDLGEKELRYDFYDVTDKDYYFNDAFNLTHAYDSSVRNDEIDIKTIDQEALYKDIYKNFGFLVEANVNRKPLINMQKEFNKKYYKRFN
ncbi:hypothetical protein [Mogibacterium diversum]